MKVESAPSEIDKYAKKMLLVTAVLVFVFSLVWIILGFTWNDASSGTEAAEWMYLPLMLFGVLLTLSFYLLPILYFVQIYLIQKVAKLDGRNAGQWGAAAVFVPTIAGIAYLLTNKEEKK